MTELSREMIRDRTDGGRFERGLKYHQQGRVRDRVRRGDDLEAEAQGSQPQPYRISVSLSKDGGVLSTACSCPDNYSGDCKHVVAVLLDWVKDPDSFKELQPVESSLEDRSRDELIALVQEMLGREPGLKTLLEEPLPGFSGGSSELVDPGPYRQDVKKILGGYQGPGKEWKLASSLSTIVSRGKDHLKNKEFGYAEAVFRSLIKETLDFYGYTHDEGDILQEVQRAIDGLIRCLNARPEWKEFREKMIDFLYWIVGWDIDFGGIGLMEKPWEAILEHAEQEDCQELREKIIEDLEGLQERKRSRWRKNEYGKLLLDLDEIDGSDKEFLQEAERFKLHKLRALKLLDLGQANKAIEVAEKIEGLSGIIEFANHLHEENEEEARQIVSEYNRNNPHDRLKKWLAEFDESKGDLKSAVELEVERFQSRPSLPKFQRVIKLAEKAGCADKYRSQLINELEDGEHFDILAKIFLEEEKWDRAWEYASKMEDDRLGSSRRIKEKIVKAEEKSRPDRALEFYLNQVHRLVGKRGRGNYRNATFYLERIRKIYEREGKEGEWERLITDLREKFDNLPACQDEFDKAGF